jgi:hypothetical protein
MVTFEARIFNIILDSCVEKFHFIGYEAKLKNGLKKTISESA